MGILNKTDFKEIDLAKQTINYKKMEKLTLQDCFKYPNARIKFMLENKDNIYDIKIYYSFINKLGCENGMYDSSIPVSDCKLILRPLSSLTDEEINNSKDLTSKFIWETNVIECPISPGELTKYRILLIDYLRSINIDIDNLQEKGVAVYE